jgi:hypothetical protein
VFKGLTFSKTAVRISDLLEFMKSSKARGGMRGYRNVTIKGETINTSTVLVAKSDGKDPLESLKVEEKIILKRILKKSDLGVTWRRFFGIRTSGRLL